VDFLAGAKQRYWQVLPLNPTSSAYGNSPYSSLSAFAGNTLLISPDSLQEEGLLSGAEVSARPAFPDHRTDFAAAIPYKAALLERAYQRFRRDGAARAGYEAFCDAQAAWLDDFSLFVVLKRLLGGLIWSRWHEELRDRHAVALEKIRAE